MTKLDDLNKKIQAYKQKHGKKHHKKSKFVFKSLNVAIEILAAVGVGLLIGFYLDKFFETQFIFKVSCMILAFIASLVNIYRTIDKH